MKTRLLWYFQSEVKDASEILVHASAASALIR